ncbi:MAG: phosphatase [Planctomycetes bacterium]|nr:phosphatase [Planctomycetota bacterium]
MQRREFLRILAFGGAAALAGPARLRAAEAPGEAKPALRFGAIADVQYADAETKGKRFYRESLAKLREAVARLNELKPDFVIHLGDLIDNGFESFDAVLPIYDKLAMPHYHVLGNHDFSVDAASKGRVLAKLGLDKLGGGRGWYDFARTGWRFIVLSGADLSTYAHAPGTPQRLASDRMLADLKARGARNAQEYGGGVGPEQLAWLREALAKADAAGQRSIVFGHYPVHPPAAHNLWNDADVLRVLESSKGLAAYICGHNHDGGYAAKGAAHFLNLKGMVDTPDTAYALVEAAPDALRVTGFGREPSRVMKL